MLQKAIEVAADVDEEYQRELEKSLGGSGTRREYKNKQMQYKMVQGEPSYHATHALADCLLLTCCRLVCYSLIGYEAPCYAVLCCAAGSYATA